MPNVYDYNLFFGDAVGMQFVSLETSIVAVSIFVGWMPFRVTPVSFL